MPAAEIEAMILAAIPGAHVEITDLAGKEQHENQSNDTKRYQETIAN